MSIEKVKTCGRASAITGLTLPGRCFGTYVPASCKQRVRLALPAPKDLVGSRSDLDRHEAYRLAMQRQYNLACFFLLDLRLTVHHAQLQAIRSWVVQTTLMHHLEPAFSGRSPCVLSFKPSSLWSRATCDATHAPGANGMPLDLPFSPIGAVHCLSSDRSMATGSTATGCTRSSPPPTIFQTPKKLAEKESLAPARFPNRTPKSDPQKPR